MSKKVKKVEKKVEKKSKKKASGAREKAEGMNEKEDALVDVIDELSDEDVDEILDESKEPAAADIVDGSSAKEDSEMVSITIPVVLKIKRKVYNPGAHEVPRHVAQTMLEMVDKKKRADISIFVGKNFVVERLIDRSLVIRNIEPKKKD